MGEVRKKARQVHGEEQSRQLILQAQRPEETGVGRSVWEAVG